MAEPKKRATSHRSGNRRSHLAAKTKSLPICPQCKSVTQSHRVCANCGYYKGEDILKLAEKEKAKAERRKAAEEAEKNE